MSEIWKGMALNWGPEIPSVIEPKDDKSVLRSSVQWIILTNLTERVMQPEFGCNLLSMLFEPNDAITAEAIKNLVQQAIARWDDRIIFVDFVVKNDNNTLNCVLTYKQAGDAKHDSYQVAEFQVTSEMFS